VSDKTAFAYSDIVPVDEVAAYLRKLAEGLRRGSLALEAQGQQISLCPASLVKVEVKAHASNGRGELKLEVSWKDVSCTEKERLQVSTAADSVEESSEPSVVAPPDQPSDA
jgi:amphi-Trp domain-containing protein